MENVALKRVAITGSSGFIGQALIRQMRERSPDTKIMGIDVQRTNSNDAKPDIFIKKDIRNKGLSIPLTDFQPDSIVHLAFIVNPMRDEKLMHEINIGGTQNLFRAIETLPVPPARVLLASSATAFGARKDNPREGFADEHPPRGADDRYLYARDKHRLEVLAQEFAKSHPNINVSWVRPCIVLGPNVRNFIADELTKRSEIKPWTGNDTPFQFVHEVDVADAILTILRNNAKGPFNLAPPDTITTTNIAKKRGTKLVWCPFWLLYLIAAICFWLHLTDIPPSVLYFNAYPFVVKPKRLQEELQFRFAYSSEETLNAFLEGQQQQQQQKDDEQAKNKQN